MNKIKKTVEWTLKIFLLITIALGCIIYSRWFWLTPLVFEYYNDPNMALIIGIILFSIFLILAFLFLFLKKVFLRAFILAIALLTGVVNFYQISAFFPTLENHIKCNGRNYYITWMHPFTDYQWTFDQLTIWNGLQYESKFFGYSQGPFEIVCDETKDMANIIRITNDVLTYSYGEMSIQYDDWTTTQLGESRYFLSFKCIELEDDICVSTTFTLQECTLEYKSCDSLFISYTDDYHPTLVLEADETNNEVSLFDDYGDNPNRTLIFTYGKNPRCYVEGCEILKP